MAIDGRRILITGASSGLGRELALLLAKRGARLALSARRERLLEELAAGIAERGLPRPELLPADLGRAGAAAELGRGAEAALGGVDVLINNAGSNLHGLPSVVGDRAEARE